MLAQTKRIQVETPAGPLFVQEAGAGEAIVFLHAGVADSRMWTPQMTAFTQAYRVVACDLRGYGQSPLPSGSFAYHKDVNAVLDALEIDKAWIVGASFGGRVAVDFALAYPERVDGLILAAALVGGYEPQADLQRFGSQEDELLEAGDVDGATELNLRMWVDGPFRRADQVDPELRRFVGEMQRHAFSIPVPDGVKVESLDPRAIHRLQEISVPCLVIVGELDVPEVVAAAHSLSAQIVGAKLATIPGVAHLPSLEAPDRFNQLLHTFMAR